MSGKQINDLGLYDTCKRDNSSRYLLLSSNITGIFNLYIGMCMNSNCSSSDI
jgi:hypothetical protein